MKTLVIVPGGNAAAVALVAKVFWPLRRDRKWDTRIAFDEDVAREESAYYDGADRVINFLGRKILKEFPKNSLNIHPGVPAFPGRGVAARTLYAILDGDSPRKVLGVTCHLMGAIPDSGKILKVFTTLDEKISLNALVVWNTIHICAVGALEWASEIEDFSTCEPDGDHKWGGRAWTQKDFVRWMALVDVDWSKPGADRHAAMVALASAWTGKMSPAIEAMKAGMRK